MFKKVLCVVIYLNLMKPLANGFVIDATKNDTFNQWLQPFNIVSAPITQWFVNTLYPNENDTSMKDTSDTIPESQKHELSESHPKSLSNTSNLETSSSANQPPEPISHVLETLRTQIGKTDNEGKKYYTELLTDIEHKFTQKSRYVRVFFNHMWHVVDLGLYGSSQRTRDASMVAGMLKPLRDLLRWIYKNAIDLLTWNIASHDDDDDEEHSEHSDKEEDEKEPHTHNEGGIKVTTRKGEKGEDHHKIIHKFEMDPFIIKLSMDITCRILDDTKDPNNASTSISHHEGDIKIHKKPLDTTKDDWDYTSTKQKLKETSPAPESGSPKDSKPSPKPSNNGVKPIPPSTGIKPDPTSANKEVVPSTSTIDKGKEPDGKKVEKDKPPTPPVSPKSVGGPNDKPTPVVEGDKKPKEFHKNPVDWELVKNPPPPGTPLSYSQQKRMLPPSKAPPPPDDDDDDDDWGPGYNQIETNPHMPGYNKPLKEKP